MFDQAANDMSAGTCRKASTAPSFSFEWNFIMSDLFSWYEKVKGITFFVLNLVSWSVSTGDWCISVLIDWLVGYTVPKTFNAQDRKNKEGTALLCGSQCVLRQIWKNFRFYKKYFSVSSHIGCRIARRCLPYFSCLEHWMSLYCTLLMTVTWLSYGPLIDWLIVKVYFVCSMILITASEFFINTVMLVLGKEDFTFVSLTRV